MIKQKKKFKLLVGDYTNEMYGCVIKHQFNSSTFAIFTFAITYLN